jgi:protein-L-isoaspartate(D-aspartate) O-methyltransferase
MAEANGFAYRRELMIDGLRSAGVTDERVLEAMGSIPRHLFVPEQWRHQAYNDVSLKIGSGQTISQPRMVGWMSQVAAVSPEGRVLEVGTGSGYQAAVLAKLARFVLTVERVDELARAAKRRLDALGIDNVSVKVMDGTLGWRAQAPYEAILVTAGAPEVPLPLIEQLADGGRLVVPVGDRTMQTLTLVVRRGDRTVNRQIGEATFVPLIGRHGWEESSA